MAGTVAEATAAVVTEICRLLKQQQQQKELPFLLKQQQQLPLLQKQQLFLLLKQHHQLLLLLRQQQQQLPLLLKQQKQLPLLLKQQNQLPILLKQQQQQLERQAAYPDLILVHFTRGPPLSPCKSLHCGAE